MFTNQRGSAGLGSIIGVAALIALYLASAGLLWKSYREGGTRENSGCQVACRPAAILKSPSHG